MRLLLCSLLAVSGAGLSLVGCSGSSGGRPGIGQATSAGVTTDTHGNDQGSASPLTVGTPIASAIDTPGDVDWFAVQLQAINTYRIQTFGLSHRMDTEITVRDGSGVALFSNDDFQIWRSDSFVGDVQVSADGTYFIVVSRPGNQGTGNYSIVVDTAPGPNQDARNQADLRVRSVGLQGSYTVQAGATFTGGVIIENVGARASVDTDVRIQFIPDGTNPTPRDLDTVTVPPIQPNLEQTFIFSGSVPNPETGRIIAIITAPMDELNTHNNTSSPAGPVMVQ